MKTTFIQDADEDLLCVLATILGEAGYKVHSFENCSEIFFSMLLIHSPDLVLLDFKLRGFECMKALKRLNTSFSKIPVIAFSTNDDIKDRYIQLGFDDYLLKPFELETLYTTLNRNMLSTDIN